MTEIDPKACCTSCFKPLPAATEVTPGDGQPEHGDATVCIHCANVMIFVKIGDRLILRSPNAQEAVVLARNKKVQRAVAAVKLAPSDHD